MVHALSHHHHPVQTRQKHLQSTLEHTPSQSHRHSPGTDKDIGAAVAGWGGGGLVRAA